MSRRSLFSNFRATTVSRIGSAGMSFVLFWWLTRKIPASEVGGFALAMSTFFALQAMQLLGLNFALVRVIATKPEQLARQVNNYWWFSLPVSLVLSIGLVAYAWIATEGTVCTALMLTALALLPTSWIVVAEAALVGIERMDWVARANLSEAAWRLIAGVVAVSLGGQLVSVLLVFLAGRLAVAALYLLVAVLPRPRLNVLPGRADWFELGGMTPVFFSIAVLAAINARYDILSLSHLVSLSEVGMYSAAAKVYEALLMVPTFASIVVLPRLSRMFQEDAAHFGAALSLTLKGGMLIATPFAVAGALAVPWFMHLVFPPSFSEAVPALQILVFCAVLAALDIVMSSTMMASNAQSSDLKCMVIGVVTIVIAMVLLVPQFGITGAALAVICNLIARVGYRVIWAARAFGVRGVWFAIVRVAACAALAWWVAGLLTNTQPWVVSALAALLVYFVGGLATGLLRASQLRLIPDYIERAMHRTP